MKPDDILSGRILIVDDQEANVLLLQGMLKAAGYRNISFTRDPTQVCELHLTNHYDLILLDILMPGMDGFQVMENLATFETEGYLPVLVITAQPDHKLRALKAGARDFISKPFDLGEVLIRVHNMLEVRLLHQETTRLYSLILEEQKVSARLVTSLLSPSLAEALAGGSINLQTLAEMTLIFSDALAFNAFSEGASGDVLKGVLGGVSGNLDDAYLATAEFPTVLADHTMAAAGKAQDLVDAMDRFNGRNPFPFRLRLDLGTLPS